MAFRIPWREELNRLLSGVPARRKPALRRSPKPEWLFATDLPACAEPGAAEAFLSLAGEAGWEAYSSGGWIHLWRACPGLPEHWFEEEPDGEAACLRALLARHPGSADARAEINLLLKSREEGPAAWERACRELHRAWAADLRERRALPDVRFDPGFPGDES